MKRSLKYAGFNNITMKVLKSINTITAVVMLYLFTLKVSELSIRTMHANGLVQ